MPPSGRLEIALVACQLTGGTGHKSFAARKRRIIIILILILIIWQKSSKLFRSFARAAGQDRSLIAERASERATRARAPGVNERLMTRATILGPSRGPRGRDPASSIVRLASASRHYSPNGFSLLAGASCSSGANWLSASAAPASSTSASSARASSIIWPPVRCAASEALDCSGCQVSPAVWLGGAQIRRRAPLASSGLPSVASAPESNLALLVTCEPRILRPLESCGPMDSSVWRFRRADRPRLAPVSLAWLPLDLGGPHSSRPLLAARLSWAILAGTRNRARRSNEPPARAKH